MDLIEIPLRFHCPPPQPGFGRARLHRKLGPAHGEAGTLPGCLCATARFRGGIFAAKTENSPQPRYLRLSIKGGYSHMIIFIMENPIEISKSYLDWLDFAIKEDVALH